MQISKKLLPLSCSLFLALMLCISTSYAADYSPKETIDIEPTEIKQAIAVSDAIALVADRVSQETLLSLRDAVGAYSLENGEVIFEFHDSISDNSDTTTNLNQRYIPIADNINLFSSDELAGFDLKWSKPKELTHLAAEGYGVVVGYQSKSDSTLWCLKMKSNVVGYSYGDFVTKFGWEVTHDNTSTALIDWSPSGTTTSSTDGATLSVKLKLTESAEVDVSFPLFAKKTVVTGGPTGRTYSVMLSQNTGISHPNNQDLNSVLSYHTGSGVTNWEWSWDIWAYQRY